MLHSHFLDTTEHWVAIAGLPMVSLDCSLLFAHAHGGLWYTSSHKHAHTWEERERERWRDWEKNNRWLEIAHLRSPGWISLEPPYASGLSLSRGQPFSAMLVLLQKYRILVCCLSLTLGKWYTCWGLFWLLSTLLQLLRLWFSSELLSRSIFDVHFAPPSILYKQQISKTINSRLRQVRFDSDSGG